MALSQTPEVGDKLRYWIFTDEYEVTHIDDSGTAIAKTKNGTSFRITEDDFELFDLVSKGADNMTEYTAENRVAKKGERIVIVAPNEHDSEDYERGDVFRVDKVDSAGVTTTTGNIVYHEEYEVLPETVADQLGGMSSEEAASAMNTALGKAYGSVDSLDELCAQVTDDIRREAEASDNVHSPQHYRQGGVEVIDIIRDAVRDADGFEAVCHANVIKYVLRYRYKNGVEDVKKARVYLDWLIAELEGREG